MENITKKQIGNNINSKENHGDARVLKKCSTTNPRGLKDYKCESCGKSFTGKQYLKIHIHTIHEGHKDHNCESCGKSFSQAGNLKKHIHTIHQGHKKYKCEYCDKSKY